MAKHIINKDLIRFVNGSASRKKEIATHLESCAVCAKRYQALLKIYQPSDNVVEPPIHLQQRILETYRAINRGQKSNLVKGIFSRYPARRLAAAAAIIIAAGFGIFFGVLTFTQRDVLPIYVYYFKGHAYIDNVKVAYHMPIKDRSKIRVENGSVLVLAYKNRFIVKIYEKSELVLKQRGQAGNKGESQIQFNLAKGTLFTRFNQNLHETKYFYLTPNAALSTSKTSFIMQVAKNKTIVIPRGGNINIGSIHDQKLIDATPEKHYVITSSIEIKETSEYSGSEELKTILNTPFNEEEMTNLRDILESMS